MQTTRKTWKAILELAEQDTGEGRTCNQLVSGFLAARQGERPDVEVHAGRFRIGQRVRTTVDTLGLSPATPFPAGTFGTVANLPDEWGDYGVVLDGEPSGRRHAYGDNELAPALTLLT
ncbi:hypothetical protein ADK57_25895 [Streptomyces sp. MMG1533]|uniref:hypothetical protein n=1 Tax=Streptomyces sp. MMG1533 TaxID=1415546 RepID=UPI0006AFB150|nr:hypothetical protein [Streptomyces sp. MMG1533]KOU62068.1 hypothetical protein ADK57_25895 [Streptomyces sp. MMG1533]